MRAGGGSADATQKTHCSLRESEGSFATSAGEEWLPPNFGTTLTRSDALPRAMPERTANGSRCDLARGTTRKSYQTGCTCRLHDAAHAHAALTPHFTHT